MKKLIYFILIKTFAISTSVAQDKTIFFPEATLKGKGKKVANKQEGKWEFSNEKGLKVMEINYTKGIANGKVIRYNEKGKKIAEATYEKNELNGKATWFENDKKIIEGNYESNEMQGKWTFLDEKGAVLKETYYAGGLKHGIEKVYQNGTLLIEATYLADELEGNFTKFFPNTQQIAEKGKYQDGKKNDNWSYFSQQGKKIQTGSYINDQKNGEWTYFFPNEKKQRIEIWQNGKLWNIINQWDETGKEQTKGSLKDGNGNVRQYEKNNQYKELVYKDGNFVGTTHYFNANQVLQKTTQSNPTTPLLAVTEFTANKKISATGWCDTNLIADSTWLYFHENGKVAEKGNYKNGKRIGYWEFYSDKGKLIESGNYQEGVKKGEWKIYDKKGKFTIKSF
jgi:antitoxin component YwqK of YwqJK toxin-antitoxin module